MNFTIALQLIIPSFALSFLLTIGAKLLAPHLGFIDSPSCDRKKHSCPMPVLGGAAMMMAFCVGVLCSYQISPFIKQSLSANGTFVITVLGVAGLFCVLGTIDDRYGMHPLVKLFGQFLCAIPFAVSQTQVSEIQFVDLIFSAQWLGPIFGLCWIILCVNAFNLIDGVDGLAGTLATVTIIAVSVLAFGQINMSVALLSIIAVGAILGFLVHNIPPAKIFMGDGGSMMLGFLVAVLSMTAATTAEGTFYSTVPIALLGVPLIDTGLAFLRRMLRGKSWRTADREHVHHRLLDRGFTHGEVVVALSSVNLLFAAAALFAFGKGSDVAVLFFATLTFAVLVSTRIIGELEVSLIRKFISKTNVENELQPKKLNTHKKTAFFNSYFGRDLLRIAPERLAECGIDSTEIFFLSNKNKELSAQETPVIIACSSQTSKEIDIPKFKQLILDNQNTEPLEYQKLSPVAGKINSDLNAQPRKMAG